MSDIATKLTYLDGTREKILTETNRLGVGLTEQDKFRDYAKGLHDGYVDVLNNGTDTLYDNMEKVSSSGSEITLENTEEAPMRSEFEGDTYQETTTGKNLCKPITTATKNGMTLTNNEDGTYTLNGTATANTSFYITGLNYPAGTYTISGNNPVANSSGAFYIQAEYSGGSIRIPFTNVNIVITGTTTNSITAWSIVVPRGLTLTNFVIKPQLEAGETATSFEEYTGGQPSPNPDYPQPINVVSGRQEVVVCGKNLLNITTTSQRKNNIDFTINEDKTVLVNGTGNSSSYLVLGEVYLVANQIYMLSGCPTGGGSGKYALSIYDSDNVRVADDFGSGKTYTPTSSGTYKVGIQYWYNWVINNLTFKPQLEKGSTASEYEEYKGQSYEINLGKNLLPYQSQDFTINNVRYYCNNGNLYLNGTSTGETSRTNQTFKDNFAFYLDAGTYTLKQNILDSGNANYFVKYISKYDDNTSLAYINNTASQATFTLTERTHVYLGFYVYQKTFDNETFNIQLEKGQATTYEEYKGQSYEINLGKNLFIPTLKVDNTNIQTIRCSASLNDDEYTVSATGSDCYFGNIIASGSPYDNLYGTLYNISGIKNLVFKPTNPAFNKNFVCFYDKDKVSLDFNQINNSTGLITPVNNAVYISFRIGISNSVSGTDYTTKIQLEKGSQATSYSPYKTPIELCKINDYKDMIFRSKGVNLFDKDTMIMSNTFCNPKIGSADGFTSVYAPCKPNTKYTISKAQETSRFFVGTTETTPAIGMTAIAISSSSSGTTKTITTGENANYIIVMVRSSSDTLTEAQIVSGIQIEEGTTATPYEPYGMYNKWYTEKHIGKIVLDGTNNTFTGKSGTANVLLTTGTITNIKRPPNNNSLSTIYCNIGKSTYTPNQLYSNSYIGTTIRVDGTIAIGFSLNNSQNITDVASGNSWLTTNNVSLYFPLATPTYTEITDSELISQLEEWYNQKSNKDTTYISVTSEDLPAILNVIAIKNYE